MSRAGNEIEEGRVIERVDIMEGERTRETKFLYERGHHLGVVFCKESRIRRWNGGGDGAGEGGKHT